MSAASNPTLHHIGSERNGSLPSVAVEGEEAPPITVRNPLRGNAYYQRGSCQDERMEIPEFPMPPTTQITRTSREKNQHDDQAMAHTALSQSKLASKEKALDKYQEELEQPVVHLRGGWEASRSYGDSHGAEAQYSKDGKRDRGDRTEGGEEKRLTQQGPNQNSHLTPSLYTSASMSYMRGQQSRTPTPRNSFQDLSETYRPQASRLQVPTGGGVHALTNQGKLYEREEFTTEGGPLMDIPHDPWNLREPTRPSGYGGYKTAEQQVNEALEESKRRMGDMVVGSAPEKSYYIFGPLKMPEPDNVSLLTADDRFKDLEGLHDSGPYAKHKQQKMYTHFMKQRERSLLEAERRKQRDRRLREEGIFNYDVDASVAPGDSISQVGYAGPSNHTYATGLSSVPEYHVNKKSEAAYAVQSSLHDEYQTQHISYPVPAGFPKPLAAPAGSIAIIPGSMTEKIIQKSDFKAAHLASKISRFLLSAPSDPSTKTYSTRLPPTDYSPATKTIIRAKPAIHAKSHHSTDTSHTPQTRDFAGKSSDSPLHSNLPPASEAPINTYTNTNTSTTLKISTANHPTPLLLQRPSLLSEFTRKSSLVTGAPPVIDKARISCPMPVLVVPAAAAGEEAAEAAALETWGVEEQRLGSGSVCLSEGESVITVWPG
ncbi:hypothetical protein J1614_003965 [Plenodomus biglobosus]|nr:hypothetical protein J1614_003965 [Plenodomus biglobosus]